MFFIHILSSSQTFIIKINTRQETKNKKLHRFFLSTEHELVLAKYKSQAVSHFHMQR